MIERWSTGAAVVIKMGMKLRIEYCAA